MKNAFLRYGSVMVLILTGVILILVVISGCLYVQKKNFQKDNRELIIKNDSIMSVNIELMNQLQGNSSTSEYSPK